VQGKGTPGRGRGGGKSSMATGLGTRSAFPWVVVAVLSLALGAIWMGFLPGVGRHHPDPRPGITGKTVVPAAQFAASPRVSAAYAQAREIAAVLDGLHCYCGCRQGSGHRSLLTCFESDHASACDVCLTEASVAHRMVEEGRSLNEIRAAIDEYYGG